MAGHRLATPPRASRIDWPADFGTRALIFVDTEEEFDWSRPLSSANRAVTATAALPAAAARFASLGHPLTYMVDHPVVTDPRAVDMVRQAAAVDGSAIGAQLHPWVNPPLTEAVNGPNSFPGNLPEALEAAKIDTLTSAIAAAFGHRPLAYRAGRYGIGPATWRLLATRGYRVDTSVRARHDYRAERGPDFSRVGNHAFWADQEQRLIELPLTTVFTGAMRHAGPLIHPPGRRLRLVRGAMARAGLLSRVALTPEGMPVTEACEAIRIAAGEGTRLLCFSFHSPSLVPGHTPYVRDAGDLAAFWRWWDVVSGVLATLGIASTGLDAVIAAADRRAGGDRP